MRKWAPILLSLVSATQASGEPPPPAVPALEAQVQLVSGKLLRGRVVGTETIQGNSLLQVDTDWGRILVPAKEVKHSIEPKPTPDATFFAGDVRVVRIQGTVERQTATAGDWFPVQWTDAYGKEIVNSPNAIVKPGDRIRTGGDGEIDLQLHKDVWVRLAPDSEILLPAARGESGSLTLLKGATIHDVTGRPRGETFRVATPTIVLGVKGTRFAVRVGEIERVEVTEGAVQVGGLGIVEAGFRGRWSDGRLARTPLTPEETERVTVDALRLPRVEGAIVPSGLYELGDGSVVGPSARSGLITSDSSNLSVRARTSLREFAMDCREVTTGEWLAFSRARNSERPPSLRVGSPLALKGRRPIMDATWPMAKAFAAWAGGLLPSEAQWEAAALGIAGRRFPWGNTVGPAHRQLPGWWTANRLAAGKAGDGHYDGVRQGDMPDVDAETVDITPLGIRNLASGVGEWTRDWSDRFHEVGRYTDAALESEVAPRHRSNASSDLEWKVVRGFQGARCHTDATIREGWGFRCVREIE